MDCPSNHLSAPLSIGENQYAAAFRAGVVVFTLMVAALLCMFLPPMVVFVPIVGVALTWVTFQHPTSALGIFLGLMPFECMAIMVGRFFGGYPQIVGR